MAHRRRVGIGAACARHGHKCFPPSKGEIVRARCLKTYEGLDMTKRQHGNKELKKPRQERPPEAGHPPSPTIPVAPAARPRVGRR